MYLGYNKMALSLETGVNPYNPELITMAVQEYTPVPI